MPRNAMRLAALGAARKVVKSSLGLDARGSCVGGGRIESQVMWSARHIVKGCSEEEVQVLAAGGFVDRLSNDFIQIFREDLVVAGVSDYLGGSCCCKATCCYIDFVT